MDIRVRKGSWSRTLYGNVGYGDIGGTNSRLALYSHGADGFEQLSDRVAHRGVVIDDQRLFEEVRDYVAAFNPELADRIGIIHQGQLLQELDAAELQRHRRRRLRSSRPRPSPRGRRSFPFFPPTRTSGGCISPTAPGVCGRSAWLFQLLRVRWIRRPAWVRLWKSVWWVRPMLSCWTAPAGAPFML